MSTEQIAKRITRGRVVVALAGVAVGLSAAGMAVTTWRATLEPPQGVTPPTTGAEGPAVGGVATVIDSGQQKVRATVHVANAKPGSVHPWHIHKGTCGKDEGIVGPASKYVPVHIGADGEGEVSEALPISLSPSGKYMVNVHASAADLKTILACGVLQKE